jgi:predicted metal-dependent hydrolase
VTEPTEPTIRLAGRLIRYRLRRSSRSRGMRATIDPRHGLVVSVPLAARRGWARPEGRVDAFLRERATWVLRHLDRLDRERAAALARGGVRDGGRILYRGELHTIRLATADGPARPTTVERSGGDDGDELVVTRSGRERRSPERILEAWLREQARLAIDRAVAAHAPALGVSPKRIDLRDPRTRWGSASRTGRLMLSWRLVLGPPESLETVVVHELVHLRAFGHGPQFWALVAARRPDHLADRAWLRRHSHALHSALEPQPPAEAAAG